MMYAKQGEKSGASYAIHRPDTYTKTPSESLRWIRMKLSTNTTMRQPIRKTVLISGNLQTKPLLFQETYKLHISRNLQTKREYSRTYKRNKMSHMMTGNKKYAHLDNLGTNLGHSLNTQENAQ